MCYNPDDRPPDPPGAPGSATGQDLELVSSDGTRFAAYIAHPASGSASNANVIIYPDVRGLHNFYKELALRFAEQGIHALAIDYFGRTAGLTTRGESFEHMPHVQQITFPTFLSDVRAAISYLQDHASAKRTAASSTQNSIFTLGFCMGGSLSLLTAAEDLSLSGAIAFYSGFGRQFPGAPKPTLDRSQDIHVPVLGIYGSADPGIPQDQVLQLNENLNTAGVPHEIVFYRDAPHSFFDRKATEFAEASADAWTQVLNFIATHSHS